MITESQLKVADLRLISYPEKSAAPGTALCSPERVQLAGILHSPSWRSSSPLLIASQVWDMNFDSDTNAIDVQ